MALSINRATIVGRMGCDPETRQTPGGVMVAKLSVATKERWTDKAGARQERTTWHTITAWDRLADIAAQLLKKGSVVYVEGKIIHSEWEDRDGNKRKRTEIRAEQMVAMETAKEREASGGNGGPVFAPPVTTREPGWDREEDMPF